MGHYSRPSSVTLGSEGSSTGLRSFFTKAISPLYQVPASYQPLLQSYCICDNPKGYWAVDGGSVKQLLLLNGGHLGGRFQTTTITKAIFSKSVSATHPNTTFQFFQSGWIPPKAYVPRFKRSILLATFNSLLSWSVLLYPSNKVLY